MIKAIIVPDKTPRVNTALLHRYWKRGLLKPTFVNSLSRPDFVFGTSQRRHVFPHVLSMEDRSRVRRWRKWKLARTLCGNWASGSFGSGIMDKLCESRLRR